MPARANEHAGVGRGDGDQLNTRVGSPISLARMAASIAYDANNYHPHRGQRLTEASNVHLFGELSTYSRARLGAACRTFGRPGVSLQDTAAKQANKERNARPMSSLDVRQIPVLSDNYVYLARDQATGECAAIDPAVAGPILAKLDALGWRLSHILNTHHHHDHVGGNLELKRATGCTIVGNAADAARIPGIDVRVNDGDSFTLGESTAEVVAVSGHTLGHIAYWFAGDAVLFCGDTLFALGCGRLFEGTPAQMWRSLSALRALPGETRVYCAHEYTEANARFALSVDPANRRLVERAQAIRAMRRAGKPTVPSTIDDERATNPFLRADVPELARAVGLAGAEPVDVFAAIRKRKDRF